MKTKLSEEINEMVRLIGYERSNRTYLTEETTTPPLDLEIPDIGITPTDRLGTADYRRQVDKKRITTKVVGEPDSIQYFKFADIADIPYAKGTEFFYIDEIDTGKLLGLTNKDEYGYYEEIQPISLAYSIRRYYPTNEWEDWAFIKNNKIPFGFKTLDGDYFHLILKLINPSLAVAELDDASNKSRGWALSQPQTSIAQSTRDAGSGYYKTVGDQQIGYNFITPIIPGDEGTYDLDARSAFDEFMDSWVGTLITTAAAIAVGMISEQWQISAGIIENAIMGSNAIRARLVVTAALAEATIELPTALYYFNREGYEQSGWLSLAFCFLPFVQGYGPLRKVFAQFDEKTCFMVAQKVMSKQIKGKSKAEVLDMLQEFTLEEKSLFMTVVKNPKLVDDAIKQNEKQFKKIIKDAEGDEFTKYYNEMDAVLRAPSSNFFYDLVKDVAFSFGYAYFFMGIMRNYSEKYQQMQAKKEEKLENINQKKIEENLTKVDEKIKSLPSWIQYYASILKETDVTKIQTIFTDEQCKDMVEKGILDGEAIKNLYSSAADKAITIMSAKEYEETSLKTLDIELLNSLALFIKDPLYKQTISPEKQAQLQELLDKAIAKNKQAEESKTTEVGKTQTGVEVTTTENPWVEETDIVKVLDLQDDTTGTIELKTERDPQGKLRYYYRQKQVTTEPQVKINSEYDKNFDYKLENNKYYYKGKGTMATKYPDWVEATGNALTNIKTNVKF